MATPDFVCPCFGGRLLYDARKLVVFEFLQGGCAGRSCAMLQNMTPLKFSILFLVYRVEIRVLIPTPFFS